MFSGAVALGQKSSMNKLKDGPTNLFTVVGAIAVTAVMNVSASAGRVKFKYSSDQIQPPGGT